MKVSGGVEIFVEEGVEKMNVDRYRYRGGVEEQNSRYLIRILINLPGVEKLSRRQKQSRPIQQVSRSYRGGRSNLDRSSRCREAIEEAKAISIDPEGVEELSGLR